MHFGRRVFEDQKVGCRHFSTILSVEHLDPQSDALFEYERGDCGRHFEGDAHDGLVSVRHRIVKGSARIVDGAHLSFAGRALLDTEPHHDAVVVLAEFSIELAARVVRALDIALARLRPCLGVYRAQHLVVVR